MTNLEFDTLVNEAIVTLEKIYGKRPHPVTFENGPYDAKTNTMLLIKSTFVKDGMVKDTGVIIRISLKETNLVENTIVVSPFYSYENMDESKESVITEEVAATLEEIIVRKFYHTKVFILCETGDVKATLKNKPEFPKDQKKIVNAS